jgi:hypothetical protein
MSYLQWPRLVFSGQFQADVSTVNNDPEHFDSSKFQPNYQQPGQTNGWWNPTGTGAWRLKGCTVQQVTYRDGSICDDPAQDSIVGAPVNDDESGVEAKLVDLDSEQQMVSQIWGLKIILGASGGPIGFSSDFEVTAFSDLFARFPAGQPDSFFGAMFQSILELTEWRGAGSSRFLQELSQGAPPTRLSIKFNVDGFNDDSTSSGFTFGRVVGSIGPYDAAEPKHFVAGRALAPVGSSVLNTAYATIVDNILAIDLGNSLTTTAPGGPLADQGELRLVILKANGPLLRVGDIPYSESQWYQKTAGIITFPLTAEQLSQAMTSPLAVVGGAAGAGPPLLAEADDGIWIRADTYVFRLNPGDHATTTFFATTFGKRTPGLKISLGYDATIMAGQTTQGPIPGPSVVGEPHSALSFPATSTTGSDGSVSVTLQASDPGKPRGYIDGQVYGVTYGPGPTAPAVASVTNPSLILSALVWSGDSAPGQPTWIKDVLPIFVQYSNLYPVMKPFVDLSDFDDVVAKRMLVKQVFSLPASDPFYMPVTRDLSRAKQAMILAWLDNPLKS